MIQHDMTLHFAHREGFPSGRKDSVVFRLLEKIALYPYPLRVAVAYKLKSLWRGFKRQHYYDCIRRAVVEAVPLGHDRISVIEFGVAGGNGLLEIEAICRWLEARHPIKFDIFGFDTGHGLPRPENYLDRPWKWTEGRYKMDFDVLRGRLSKAELIIGDVAQTVPEFLLSQIRSPIGAAMFDLDYHSSTISALKIFNDEEHKKTLPRVLCYFDDTGQIEDVGVVRAISDFNEWRADRKLKPYLSRPTLVLAYEQRWKIFEYHDFAHPQYSELINLGHDNLALH
jgi:hypothetical protein